jgi:hypothetical protein
VIYELHDLTKGAERLRELGTIQYFESFFDWFSEDGGWQAPSPFTGEEADAVAKILAVMREAEAASREMISDDAFIQAGWPERIGTAAWPVLALLTQRGLTGERQHR